MSQVKVEYAQALFMLAMEKDSVEDFKKALDEIADAFSKEPKYMQFLSSPGIALSERLSAIEEAFGSTYPRDLLIGEVISVEVDGYLRTKVAYVKCAVKFESLTYVMIVTDYDIYVEE